MRHVRPRAAPTADKFGMMARPFLAGLTERLGRRVPILGGSQIGTFAQTRAAQWVNDQASVGAALGVVLTSDLRVDTVITHGCTPSSSYHTVTAADGANVLELDERPATEVVKELVSPEMWEAVPKFPGLIAVGVNHGDLYGAFHEEDYAILGCGTLDPTRGFWLQAYAGSPDDNPIGEEKTGFINVPAFSPETVNRDDEVGA